MTESQFAIVPLEVIQDRRLTLEQTRVLIALFSFRNKVTNVVWPSRQALAERTGLHPSNISAATTALVGLGWLTKEGLGGHSKSTRYTLNVPEVGCQKVAQQATVADSATVAHSATSTIADSATTPLADSATRKEQTIEHTNEQRGAGKPATPRSDRTKTLTTYLAECKQAGVKPIPEDHHIRGYMKAAGITEEMGQIAWLRFREEHTTGVRKAKRYIDWPGTFANSIKARWYRLWVVNANGEATWTSEGLQEKRAIEAQRKEQH